MTGIHLPAYQVSAFTTHPLAGNPAGVCILGSWPEDVLLKRIAHDLGPSVTAFLLIEGGEVDLRWFTRGGREVLSFCGHATFAAAHVLAYELRHPAPFRLRTISGVRPIAIEGDMLTMGIPNWASQATVLPPFIGAALRHPPAAAYWSERDHLLVYDDADAINALDPDFKLLAEAGEAAVIATARDGDEIVFRFFCPGFSISENEDPATGSAVSALAPFWSRTLGWTDFRLRQLSARGGSFSCRVTGNAVTLRASCATFLTGSISL